MRPVLLWIAAGLFAATWFAPSRISADEFRTLTNTEGRTIRAKVLKVEGGAASVQLEDGRRFDLPLASLSQADRESLEQWAKGAPTAPPANESGIAAEAVNAAIGHELFADRRLWDSDPGETAERLSWKRESKTELSESYRSYPREDYRFLGARPYSTALYGEEGKITGLSVVFANKGDSYADTGEGEQHFIQGKPVPGGMEGVKALMKHDTETISKALTELLGEPNRQKFGEGESRVAVERWDWNSHAFLLSHVEGEYVSLAVETTVFADARGRSARVPDSTVRERIRKFVERRDNGDVVITNIPMVDQGPKGYCVPATAERCMRFLGIPADMYLLAMAGETRAGGGTSVDLLLSNIGRDIKRKGRSFDIKSGELKMRDIKRSIDGGIPIIWALYSTRQFNETADARKEARSNDSWDSYKSMVAAASSTFSPEPDTAHVVIIMGYNEATSEIAFSDSWGERYLERWITLSEAEQVSQKRFYVIDL